MWARWLVAVACFALVSCASIPQRRGLLPDPLEPPVPGPALAKGQKRAAQEAVALAEASRLAEAKKKLGLLPKEHPLRQLLQLELRLAAGEEGLWPAVQGLAQSFPHWPPPWRLALLVAEREGRLLEAAEAAQRLSQLVPQEGWQSRQEQLVGKFLAAEEAALEALLVQGKGAEAWERGRSLLARFPQRRSLREMVVRAALAADKVAEAKLLVLPLPEDGPGLELKAAVAAQEKRWDVAVALLRQLPPSYPGRCGKLRQAEDQARWQGAPATVREAAESPRLTRAQLASLLAFYFPQLEGKAQGPVPLFEDVVGIPQQREVLLVARAGLLNGDPLTRRFSPKKAVSGPELGAVLRRLLALLGLPEASLCPEGEAREGCLSLPGSSGALAGREVASLLSRLWGFLPC